MLLDRELVLQDTSLLIGAQVKIKTHLPVYLNGDTSPSYGIVGTIVFVANKSKDVSTPIIFVELSEAPTGFGQCISVSIDDIELQTLRCTRVATTLGEWSRDLPAIGLCFVPQKHDYQRNIVARNPNDYIWLEPLA